MKKTMKEKIFCLAFSAFISIAAVVTFASYILTAFNSIEKAGGLSNWLSVNCWGGSLSVVVVWNAVIFFALAFGAIMWLISDIKALTK